MHALRSRESSASRILPGIRRALNIDRPGYALWHPPGADRVPIDYRLGRLIIKEVDKARVAKAKQIAKELNARVVDHHGKVR